MTDEPKTPVSGATATLGGISLTTILVLFALHGEGAGRSLMSLWSVLLAFTRDAPLGLMSFLLALGLAMLSQPFLHRWLPHLKCPLSRSFIVESAALAIGLGVMYGQLQTLMGAMTGVLAGLLAPYLEKGLEALYGLGMRGLGHMPRPPK